MCDASSPLWERACSRRHHWGLPGRSRRLFREQARSHIKGCCFKSGYCLCFGCSQGNVQTTRMPLFQFGVCGGYVLGGSVVFAAVEQRTYPFDAPRLSTGFALTARHFCQTATKVPKKALPRRTALASLRCPSRRYAPWARRDGPSLAQHGSPGIHAGRPTAQNLHSASRRGR